ncbi:MAG: hypothetical protein AAGH15_27210, partial [Myxococcota bacterium]
MSSVRALAAGAHLVMGTRGRRWALEDGSDVLGHGSNAIAERYAQFAPHHLDRAAEQDRRKVGPGGP